MARYEVRTDEYEAQIRSPNPNIVQKTTLLEPFAGSVLAP